MAAVADERSINEGITVAWVVGKTLEVFKFTFDHVGDVIVPTKSWPLG